MNQPPVGAAATAPTSIVATAPEWKKQLAKELLTRAPQRFARRRVYASGVDAIWTADLADMTKKYTETNDGYRYILVVIDVFSRYAWARALRQKTGPETAAALRSIIRTGVKCQKFWSDRGKEFENAQVRKLFRENDITAYSTHNEPKAMLAERFIRTLRKKIETSFILTDSTVWYTALDECIEEYNNEGHRHLHGLTPQEARSPNNADAVYRYQFDKKFTEKDRLPYFSVGDKVRISLHKQLFEKEATASWTEEIFRIHSLVFNDRVMYTLEDLAGEQLRGNYYQEQLQATNQNIYRIDKILRKRTRAGHAEVLVKWSGYSDNFNSWEPANYVHRSGEHSLQQQQQQQQ